MDRIPGDPYEPENHPLAPADASEEEDPEEDPSEEEYEPAEVPESDEEGILEEIPLDDNHPKESHSDEEVVPPPLLPVRAYYQPHCLRGQEPMPTRTPRISDMPRFLPDISPFLSQPPYGQKRKATDDPPRFERGESSRAPPHDDPIPPVLNNRFPIQVRPLEEIIYQTTEQRVEELEKKAKEDSEAIQTLYHRMGASRTEVNRMAMTIQSMEYELEVSQNRHDAAENRAALAEEELRLVRQQQEELGDFVGSRLI